MTNAKWKTLSLYLFGAMIFIIGMGALSYFTANGEAVIGPNPTNIDAQKAGIVQNALYWALSVGAVLLFSFAMSKRRARKPS